MEYNFKDIYKTFNISYFSKNDVSTEDLVDLDELRKYESIELSGKDRTNVLIKKFKFRVSIMKTSNFTEDIVVSDTSDLDVNQIAHSDNLIKIALVRDDIDKWISNPFLEEYDYIITNDKEFASRLKDKNPYTYVIEGNCVYVQLKNILNLLFKRKLDKFHYLTKRFDKAFPKQNNYFKVLNSDYFDEEWYREKYEISKNTDSIIHYLLVGFSKGYDPSPEFSIKEYYECNEDIKSSEMNPLVHYEKYGKKENRVINFSQMNKRNYSIIKSSPCFDKEWYECTYNIPGDVDSIDHYLNIGFKKGYNPGPNFNTYEYFECNEDVKEKGENPLIHYELFGRKEGREISFSDEVHQENYSLISNSPYFDSQWYANTYGIPSDVDPTMHYLNDGFNMEYDPSSDFSTSEYYECNIDVKENGMNPLLHYEKIGRQKNRIIHVSDIPERDYNLISNSPYFDGEWYADTYNLPGNVDPVDHYLKVGYIKNYNPSSNFNTHEYYQCNVDIKNLRINPLLHYELYGRDEERSISYHKSLHEMFYSTISNSSYFDREWYVKKYNISNDIDPVTHYLNIGYAMGYDPSSEFSTEEYYKFNVDVKFSGMNPLYHYERFGKNEGRPIFISDEELNQIYYDLILNSPNFDRKWYADTYDIPDSVDPVNHYLNEGFKMGYDPSPYFSGEEYYNDNAIVKLSGFNPLLYQEYAENKSKLFNR